MGCVAPPYPIAGYPTGRIEKEPRLLCSSSPVPGDVEIYEQEIEHDYRLVMSPEGGRESVPLKSSYRYLIRIGDQPIKELKFLRCNAGRLSGEHFAQIYSVGEQKWVGYGRSREAPDARSSSVEIQGETERLKLGMETSRYFISMFSPKGILSRIRVTAMTTPNFEYLQETRAVRFLGPSGWMLYLIEEGRVIPEPKMPDSNEMRGYRREESNGTTSVFSQAAG